MQAKIEIPKGFHRLRIGAKFRYGDFWFDRWKMIWSPCLFEGIHKDKKSFWIRKNRAPDMPKKEGK